MSSASAGFSASAGSAGFSASAASVAFSASAYFSFWAGIFAGASAVYVSASGVSSVGLSSTPSRVADTTSPLVSWSFPDAMSSA